MDQALVRLEITRPCMVGGARREPGSRVELPPAEALDLAESGRAELVDLGDRYRCVEARRRRVATLLARRDTSADGYADPRWRPL